MVRTLKKILIRDRKTVSVYNEYKDRHICPFRSAFHCVVLSDSSDSDTALREIRFVIVSSSVHLPDLTHYRGCLWVSKYIFVKIDTVPVSNLVAMYFLTQPLCRIVPACIFWHSPCVGPFRYAFSDTVSVSKNRSGMYFLTQSQAEFNIRSAFFVPDHLIPPFLTHIPGNLGLFLAFVVSFF